MKDDERKKPGKRSSWDPQPDRGQSFVVNFRHRSRSQRIPPRQRVDQETKRNEIQHINAGGHARIMRQANRGHAETRERINEMDHCPVDLFGNHNH